MHLARYMECNFDSARIESKLHLSFNAIFQLCKSYSMKDEERETGVKSNVEAE